MAILFAELIDADQKAADETVKEIVEVVEKPLII